LDPNLLVGFGGADDAGVYRLDDETALVVTVDYFTPIVDDPYDFGLVAAVNSLSDVYAMGGEPLVALNVAGFPEKKFPPTVLADILKGGMAGALKAGVPIAGGHTVSDEEIKYGLSVVGRVHPDRVIRNSGARPGDMLVLTKPLGTGVLSTRHKAGELDDAGYEVLVESMSRLNKAASVLMREFDAHASTDITGYGFLGHALEMAEGSAVTIDIVSGNVPMLDGAVEAVRGGFLTGGGGTNKMFVNDRVTWAVPVDETLEHILFDPQTSGGLLIAVAEDKCSAFIREVERVCPGAAVVGRVRPAGDTPLVIS
jgi:selenide,water dikinase